MTDKKSTKPKEPRDNKKTEHKIVHKVEWNHKIPFGDSSLKRSQRITSEQKPPEKPKKSD